MRIIIILIYTTNIGGVQWEGLCARDDDDDDDGCREQKKKKKRLKREKKNLKKYPPAYKIYNN